MSDRWEFIPTEPTEGLAQAVPIPASTEVDVTRWPSGADGTYLAVYAGSVYDLLEEEES